MLVLRKGSSWEQFLLQIHIIEEISQEHRICQVYNIVERYSLVVPMARSPLKQVFKEHQLDRFSVSGTNIEASSGVSLWQGNSIGSSC